MFSFIGNTSFAQTLTEKLIAENPTKLAEEARAYGNIVRGAILFHQGNINCIKCHRASAAADGIGPDLSRIEPDATDAFIIESILEPSKVIKKGFETVVVLTLDGQLIRGSMVSETDESVVIRDGQNVDRLITLPRDDIDEIRPGKESNMPAKLAAELSGEQKIEVSLVTYNCIACHSRGDLGGVTSDRNPHFQTTNLNLGDQGRIPPVLSGVGAKLKTEWMRDVLVNHRKIRPYMKTRMPQYGEANIGHLVELFQSQDQLPETKFAKFEDQKTTRQLGHHLAGNKGLNCVACHTYQFKISDTMPAVDLTEMAERLKKDWFYQYMLNPQKFSPNTVMPSFWPGGQAINKDIAGSPEDQLEALWQYLLDGRQAPMPSGVVREPLEIVVNEEAEMLRRSYPDIGKRGIGVGYPGGINVAFDAEPMRVGMIWKGKFADPSGVWTGQGAGKVQPLGSPINFPLGPELDSATEPWLVDAGRPPHHRFRGYSLDEARRPTFEYTFASMEVKDYFREVINPETQQIHLRRSVTITSKDSSESIRFRIAADKQIVATGEKEFAVGKRLKVRLRSPQPARITESGGEQQLSVTLEAKPGEEQQLEIEYYID